MEGRYVLFSWGANSYGQLGLGNTEDKLLPSQVMLDSSQASSLKQISGGGGHTVLLKNDGVLIVFGWNKNGQCGVSNVPSSPSSCPADLLSPQPLPHQPWKVVKVACGWNHTLALLDSGRVMAWGSNAFGQLGVPSIEKYTSTPTEITMGIKGDHVTDISAGLRHSLAVMDGAGLLAWGDGKKGQLGLGARELAIQRHPRNIFLPAAAAPQAVPRPMKVSAGAYHSTAITGDGSLLSWGLNQHGQCGVGTIKNHPNDPIQQGMEGSNFKQNSSGHITHVYAPVRVRGVASLAEVYCGWSHTLVVTEGTRRVYGWGRADYGQLGLGIDQHVVDCSRQDTAQQDSQTGEKMVRDEGGSQDNQNQDRPAVQDSQNQDRPAAQDSRNQDRPAAQDSPPGQSCEDVSQDSVSGQTTADQSGATVLSEQSTTQSTWNPVPMEITQLKQVQQVALGSEHTLVITCAGEIAAFGWNEHGMCGTGDEENVGVVTRVPGLPSGESGGHMMVGAGAGHSLALVKLNGPAADIPGQ